MTLFTLSLEDFFDFSRCPRIVSIKAYVELHPPPRPPGIPEVTRGNPQLMGKLGESAVQLAFAAPHSDRPPTAAELERARRLLEHQLLLRLQRFGLTLDQVIQESVRQTAEGVLTIRQHLESKLGRLDILGRGQSRNGALPGSGRFDFVAVPEKTQKPTIVEVKNVSRYSAPRTEFQAAFYNALARRFGVVIYGERFENGAWTIAPSKVRDIPSSTIIMDLRRGETTLVDGCADISQEMAKRVWEAKQLGFSGKWPDISCSSPCPHERFGVNLPSASLEAVPPLPLSYGLQMIESDENLDFDYLEGVIRSSPLGSLYSTAWLDFNRSSSIGRPDLGDLSIIRLADTLGVDVETLLALRRYRNARFNREGFHEPKEAVRAWGKLLGKKRVKDSQGRGGAGVARRVYALPSDSEKFVKDAAAAWHI